MSWTLCTSGAAVSKAGIYANSTITTSGATLAMWSDEAESLACDYARSNVVTNYSTLTSSGKYILQDFCSSHIAQKIISYDPDAIGKSATTLRLNILENNIRRIITILEDDKYKTYLGVS